jgi:DDE domain
MAEMMLERGLEIDPSCIWRWVQEYGPEPEKRCRPHLKPTSKSYRMDETYIKVKGNDRYLYRAVDSTGQTIDFLLTAKCECCRGQTLLSKGSGRFEQLSAASHQCGQEPGLRACSYRVTVRRGPSPELPFTPMQVLEQHSGARPSNGQKAGMVGERLRLVPWRMENDPGCGSSASDPQGTSEEGL